MKHYLLSIILISIITSCNNKSAKEKLEIENAKQAVAINQIVGVGKIIPENDIIQLSSPVNGIVRKIYKKENDTVSIGSVILELEHYLEDEKMMLLSNELTTQTAQIKVDAANIDEFEAKVSNAKLELQRLQNLLSKGAETQQTVDDVTTNIKALSANLNKLEATVTVSKSRLQENKTNFKTAQLEREQKIIRSPVNGRILELTVLIGGSVSLLNKEDIKPEHSADHTTPDEHSDKTNADDDNDGTVKKPDTSKSKLEVDPDTTGIDTTADKTKKEDFPNKEEKKL